jgi:branched-chain amino acid aminotransferase
MSMNVSVERVARSRLGALGNWAEGPFSTVFSDHLLTMEYAGGAWGKMRLRPYGSLDLPPSITGLQYGATVFEALKAHRTPDGRIALFRPRLNARRLARSARRLAMPELPEEDFVESLKQLVDLDRDWVPAHDKGALYIRPTLFSIDTNVRVKPAERYLFTIFSFPFSAYYAAPVDALACERYVRAFPGGVGDVKAAGNYAAALIGDLEARDAGFSAVLWLDAQIRAYVEEFGVMNAFFVIDGELITPTLEGTILAGVTRDSILALARGAGLKVSERRIAIDEVFAAFDRGVLAEAFGTGTAATLTQVRRIRHGQRELQLSDDYRVGPALREKLVAIASGAAADPNNWLQYV